MAWGAAIGAIGGALISANASDDQADVMEGATQEQIDLMREKFDYARNLQEALLAEQAPRRRAAQDATRSLAMMAGLEDPGGPGGGVGGTAAGGGTGSALDQFLDKSDEIRELEALRDKFEGTDKFITTGGSLETKQGGAQKGEIKGGEMYFDPESTKMNPEFLRLEEEIASLEQELQGGTGAGGGTGDDFTGPTDVTEMPGYQFAVEQGQEALASSGAARGMQLSGNQLQDITEFGQGTAMKFRGQLIDQLAQVAGMRPSASTAQNLATTAVSEGQNISSLLGQMGQIGAAREAGQAGAMGSAFANMPWDQMFNNNNTTTTTTSGNSGFQSTQGVASATPRTF